MADTQRAKTSLATLLADNTSGDISPQDLRDFMESMDLATGLIYISSSAATTIGGAGTFVKAAGTTTSIFLNRCTMPADNRLTYTGTPTVNGIAFASASISCGSASQEFGIRIAENGSTLATTDNRTWGATASQKHSISTWGYAALATNDYLEVFVCNETGANNITVNTMLFGFIGLFD